MNQDDLTTLRLHNQQLLGSTITNVAEMVGWSGAVQSQDFAGAKLSLGLRLWPTTDSTIDKAFDDGRILRTHVMRPTWHFVTPADMRWILNLTSPRVQQQNATAYRQVGMDDALLHQAGEIMVEALRGGQQLTRPELGAAVEAQGIGGAQGLRLTHMVMWAELEALICSGPRRGKQFTYMALDERAPDARTLDREDAQRELLRRFIQSHGPITDRDFARWSGLTLTDTRAGLAELGPELESAEMDGQTYWHLPAPNLPRPEPRAFLVSIYDEYTIGYKDFGSHVDAQLAREMREMGNALQNVIIVNGRVRGSWRRVINAKTLTVELNPMTPMTAEDRELVAAAAEDLGALLARPANVVWPAASVRPGAD